MQNNILLIVTKRIDGGTGTFVQTLNRISLVNYKIINLVLRKPVYRKINKIRWFYHISDNLSDEQYRLSLKIIVNFLLDLLWIFNQIRIYKPKIILGVDIYCNILVVLNKLLYFQRKHSVILSTHINLFSVIETKSSSLLKFILSKSVSYFYSHGDSLISVSKGVAHSLKLLSVTKSNTVIHYGISGVGKYPKKISDKSTILTVSRLVKQKDIPTLIKAFYLLTKELNNTRLIIIGDGEEKYNLKQLARVLGLENKVIIRGWCNDVDYYYKTSDIFVLSSKREGLPYVLLESLSFGLPTISSDCDYGPREILGNNIYGLLVPPGNAEALKNKLLLLLTNKKKYDYYAKAAMIRSNYFSLNQMLSGYKKIILNLDRPSKGKN